MQEILDKIKIKLNEKLSRTNSIQELDAVRVEFLGKTGEITNLFSVIKNLEGEERKNAGQNINNIRNEAERLISDKLNKLENEKIQIEIDKAESYDGSVPPKQTSGSLHPITIVTKELTDIFKSMGFVIEDGFEIETDFNNFEAVNVPKDHPARDMQDTFWLENGQVLKTHTSASQNRILKKYGGDVKAVFPGRCYRNEDLDNTHEISFFQMEGMVVGENISIANFKYFMKEILSKVLERDDLEVRLRPGYFPFTEPSFELDVNCQFCSGKGCPTCKQAGWIELCPGGIIHPNVLRLGGVDPEIYTGFAFGLGLTRLTMMKYGLKDIRLLNSGNISILSQVGIANGKEIR